MSSQKLEYDSTMGGPVMLGSHLVTYRYAAGALQEMRELLDAVKHPTSTKLVFQTLPKHMRRRAMSHHPKRLPRKYRAAHCAQMAKAGKPQFTHRPSRKYRRRPGNLLREYLRRQRRHVWLETHIWHARRFHMIERWGYRLPYASCDKTYRACYRASTEHCLLQDFSFHACLQLQGPVEELRLGFARLTSPECGLSITAKTYLNGRREGSIEVFRDRQYPADALGRVLFMWCAAEEETLPDMEEKQQRTLWLWIHPNPYKVILEELIKVFELVSLKSVKVKLELEQDEENDMEIKDEQETDCTKNNSKTTQKQPVKKLRRLQFMTRTLAYERVKRYANSMRSVQLSELKDTMNRFRLTGPLSQSVLTHAFKAKQYTQAEDNETESWFHTKYAENVNFQQCHETQVDYWQQCSQQITCPTELMSNMIIALNIDDPRIHRPQKRTKAVPQTTSAFVASLPDLLVDAPTCLPQSVLWEAEMRDSLCERKVSPQAYCELRAKHVLVPGAACRFEQELQPVPVLLIQRPGTQNAQYKRLGYGCGWDVIVPAGYGMSIWLSLIMWGARPGGLREFDSIARESGTEHHLPDTLTGQQNSMERCAELRAKYFRLPPSKRCNYHKFAIVSPFRAPLLQLVRDWTNSSTEDSAASTSITSTPHSKGFHVLRNRALLQELSQCLARKQLSFPACLPSNCLIQLQMRMKTRGSVDDFALICLPTRADLKRNLRQMQRENRDPVYTEPLLPDANEKERQLLRQQHKRLLKRLRARRVREKRKQQETSTTRVHIRAAGTAALVAAQFNKMCALWLPDESCSTLQSVRGQCTREVFGYITSASFSYTEATVCAIGYVTAAGFRQLLALCQQARLKQPICLVRGTKTRHYRFASFKLNLQV